MRSPLTGVLAYAAELHLHPTVNADADASWCTDRISAAALRMGTLIDDVLAQATTGVLGIATEVDLTEITNNRNQRHPRRWSHRLHHHPHTRAVTRTTETGGISRQSALGRAGRL
ncbi:hypothetical protein [Actinoplanes sp. NBC_00393]|uniref:hypothetical protein n=1 Tax=Actinoplanes sp. NBC_00393 TaxID=2975953 RepID=UPI003FA41C2A